MRAEVRSSSGVLTAVLGVAITVVLACGFLMSGVALAIPHGGYTVYSVSCQSCHSTHAAPSAPELLIIQRNQTDLCYVCHDGLGSVYDVKTSFGTTDAPAASAHPLGAQALSCGSCHTPHLGPAEGNPRSLSVGPSRESTGNAVCAGCHGVGSALPGGDIATGFTGSAHDTSTTPPPSGTGITCLVCHQPHGSTNVTLLKTSLVSLSATTTTVSVTATSGPRPLCEGCHDAARADYPGPGAYAQTKHGGQAAGSTAATQYPGVSAPAGDCVQCHDAHGTGDPNLLRKSGRQLCFQCHDSPLASRPATSSYAGAATYVVSAHSSLDSTPGARDSCATCHAVHGGGDKNPDGTTPAGQLRKPSGRLCTGDGTGCHATAASSAAGVNVLAAFEATSNDLAHHDVMPAAQTRTGAKIACTDCHNPHRETATDTFSDPDALGSAIATGFERFVGPGNRVFALVGAEHDGMAPAVTAESVDTSAGMDAPVFTWTTNEPATTLVDWGRTTSYELGSFGTTVPLTTTHAVPLSGVDTTTPTYHYRIRSADALGNQTVTADRTYWPQAVIVGAPTQLAPANGDTVFWIGSSVNVMFSWQPVTILDGDQPRYTLEFTRTQGVYSQTGSVDTLASNYATRFPGGNASVTWRVKATDPVHTFASTPWTPLTTFQLSYVEAMAPAIGPRMLFAQASSNDLVTDVSAPTQVQVAEPQAPQRVYSLDTDAIGLQARAGDRPATTIGPAAGWSTSASELLKPTPSSPGTPDKGSSLASGAPDGQYWTTDLTTADHDWNWQLARFDVDTTTLASAQEVALKWTGHGEPSAGYRTSLYLWDFRAATWVSVSDLTGVGTDTTVVTKVTQPRTIAFCLRCHDGSMPPGVVAPSALATISSAWTTTGPDAHGDRAGITFNPSGLVAGYSRGSSALDCTVCHDPHGSKNIYHFNEVMNGTTPVTVTDGNSAKTLCYSCHTGTVAVWHQECANCHDGAVTGHSSGANLQVVTPDENSDCLSCHKHGRTWEHKECLSCHGVTELTLLGAGSSAHTETFNLF